MSNNEKELLTIKDVVKILNVKESWLRSAVFQKTIPFLKIGHLIRFQMIDLEIWINQNRYESKQEAL
jgi:excisionase family DNA binding protein